MLEVFMTEDRKKLKKELEDFVAGFPRQLLVDMDADKVTFPKEFLERAAAGGSWGSGSRRSTGDGG